MRRILMAFVLTLGPASASADWLDWFLTPDQQAQRLFDAGDYAAAAERFTTPDRIGAALFRAGDFENAAAVLGRVPTAEGAFNRGNALVLLGRYDDAIASYARALELRPGWPEAEENLRITELRKERLAPPEDDYGGTGGKLGADEIVIDTSGRVANSGQEQVVDGGDRALSEEAMRAMWLRRVETRPADFLAAKFAYQLATGTAATGESEAADD